jgi:hypothetical protein
LKNPEISLDDKKLVEQFHRADIISEEFIFDLLQYRTFFDKYVIKQELSLADENKQNWGVRKLQYKEHILVKTYGKDNDSKDNEDDEELVKNQTVLYYSNTTNTYNNWLQEILKNEYWKNGQKEDLQFFTQRVFDIAKKRFNIERVWR